MTDDFEERLFALAERHFPSLDALHAFFAAQIARTESRAQQLELKVAQQVATEHHLARAAAQAAAPIPTPPAPPKPPPEPPPPGASEEEKAVYLYGPSFPVRAVAGHARIRVDKATETARATPIGREQPLATAAADNEAALQMYGGSIGLSLGAGWPKRRPTDTAREDDVKANRSKSRRHERAMNKKFEAMKQRQPTQRKSPQTAQREAPRQEEK